MNKRSIEIHKNILESREKFDYFVCGVAGALFAYLGQNYTPRKLENIISAIEPMALLSLVAAFYFGMKLIEAGITVKRVNFQMLDAAEKAGNMTKALSAGSVSGLYANEEGGEVFTKETALSKLNGYVNDRNAAQAAMEPAQRKTNRLYKCRNACLYVGFCAIFAAKIFQPYSSLTLNATSAAKAQLSITKTNTP